MYGEFLPFCDILAGQSQTLLRNWGKKSFICFDDVYFVIYTKIMIFNQLKEDPERFMAD